MKLETLAGYASAAFLTLLGVTDPSGSVAAGKSEPTSASTAALATERAARPPATSDLGEWVGVYPFSEFFEPDQFYEYRIAIQDRSGASLIVANGHMTCYRLNGIAKAAGANKVNIYYESDALGCSSQKSFSKGNLLVSIERKPKGYVLHWEALSAEGPPSPTVYRQDQGIAEDGKKFEGPYLGEGFFNRISPGGRCGYELRYLVFYNINPQVATKVNDALRAVAGVPSAEEMKKCDEAQRREPPAEAGPRYCKDAREVAWLNGDRIGSVQVQLSEWWPCAHSLDQEMTFNERGLTFDLKTGRFFTYNDLFRPKSCLQVDKLIFGFLAGKMKPAGIDYPWAQFLKDKKDAYEFCLWTNVNDRRLVTLKILDFPDEWFRERVSVHGGLEPELPLDQLKSYASPDGPLALLFSGSKQASTESNLK